MYIQLPLIFPLNSHEQCSRQEVFPITSCVVHWRHLSMITTTFMLNVSAMQNLHQLGTV